MGRYKKENERSSKNKIEMIDFLNRVKLVALVLIVVTGLFVYFFIYNAMVKESKTSMVEKFQESGNLNHYMIKYSIDRAKEGTKSLSSRTMIKEAIVDYLDGKKSLEELKTYSQDKYLEGVKALDNIIYAERIVEGESIVKYTRADKSISQASLEKIISEDSMIIDINEGDSRLEIYSPIKKDQEIIGHDYLVYTIRHELDSLSGEKVKVELTSHDDHIQLLENSQILESNGDRFLLQTDKSFYVLSKIEGKYLYTKISKLDLFEDLNTMIGGIAIASIAIIIFLSLSIYIFIIKYAHDKISNLDQSRAEFKSLAYIDQLTGAYSRRFLEDWHEKCIEKDESYSLVMIDVDDFKNINDLYGHSRGDLILKRIAGAIINKSRTSDLVVRLGGDEFLVILPATNIKEAEKFMERVEREIESIDDIFPPATISFGICSFTEESYQAAIDKADELMYIDKRSKEES